MRRLLFAIGVAAILLFIILLAIAFAQRGGNGPTIPTQIQRLYIFQGTWEGEANMIYQNQALPKFRLKHENSILEGKWGLYIRESADIPTLGRYYSANLLGYDSGGDKVHLYTVSNFGDTHDHAGNWVNDTTLVLEYRGLYEGKPMVERLPIIIPNSSTYSFADTVFVDDVPVNIFRATMTKR
jgi:hypothetical protein